MAHLPGNDGALSYKELATTTGLSAEALRMRVNRLRKRFRDLFLEEVGKTVKDPADIEDEIRHLMQALLDFPDDDENQPPPGAGGQGP